MKERNGFTLAEVLVTLMIIGVIASVTIPGLKKSADEQQYIAGLKKAYSVLSQAVSMSENDNGSVRRWNFNNTNTTFFNDYLKPYLNINKDCGTDANCYGDETKLFNGGPYNEFPNTHKVILNDGMRLMILDQPAEGHTHLLVDVNGNQRPNKIGIDTFVFTLTPKAFNDGLHKVDGPGVYYYGAGIDRAGLLAQCTSTGHSCGALIILDGDKMKY